MTIREASTFEQANIDALRIYGNDLKSREDYVTTVMNKLHNVRNLDTERERLKFELMAFFEIREVFEFTCFQYSRYLGVSYHHAVLLCGTGNLPDGVTAEKVDGKWQIFVVC